jgi:LuxR family maltose regulon positive regulatory protein
MSWAVGGLARLLRELKKYEEAQQYHWEHLALCKEVGDQAGVVWTLLELGMMSLDLGETETSRRLIAEALPLLPEIGWNTHTFGVFLWAERLMAQGGQSEQRLELLALILSRSEPQPAFQRKFLRRLDELKAGLPPEIFAAAVRRGEARNLEAVVADLLAHFTAPPGQQEAAAPDAARLPPDQSLTDPLNERELEILRLLADGLNSREVAQRLHLGVSTIRWYLKHIYGKLDAHSRSEALARARELKLLA